MNLKTTRPLPDTYPKEINTLGDHIRKRRLDLKLLQKEIATQLGVDTSTITNWEKNRCQPALWQIPRIVQFLGYVPFDDSNKSLGERIVAARRLLGVSQEKLARQLGVDPVTLWRWEKGESRPSKNLLKVLSALLQSGKNTTKSLNCVSQ